MIPSDYLQEWAETAAPWPDPAQIEQDLIISRALCDLFNEPRLAGKLAFRGGSAIHKLVFLRPLRYSEDIDLVQVEAGPIGPIIDGVRSALAWLGPCKREPATHSMHMTFRFEPEGGGPTMSSSNFYTARHRTQNPHPSGKRGPKALSDEDLLGEIRQLPSDGVPWEVLPNLASGFVNFQPSVVPRVPLDPEGHVRIGGGVPDDRRNVGREASAKSAADHRFAWAIDLTRWPAHGLRGIQEYPVHGARAAQ